MPVRYESAGQNRDESGVSTSSASTSVPSASRPNSNFVSARMIPRAAAWSAANAYSAIEALLERPEALLADERDALRRR